LITENVIVDKHYKEAPGNIVIENEDGLDVLKAMMKVVISATAQKLLIVYSRRNRVGFKNRHGLTVKDF